MEWQRTLDRLSYELIQGDGFSIKLVSHSTFFRYIESGRELTLFSKIFDDTERWGRRLIFFKSFTRIIYVPTAIRWDDGALLAKGEYQVISERILNMLSRNGHHTTIVVDDKLYEEIQRDVDSV